MNTYDRIINMLLEARIEDYIERLDERSPEAREKKERKRRWEVELGQAAAAKEDPEGLDYKELNTRTKNASKMASAAPHTQPRDPLPGVTLSRSKRNKLNTAHAFFRSRHRGVQKQTSQPR